MCDLRFFRGTLLLELLLGIGLLTVLFCCSMGGWHDFVTRHQLERLTRQVVFSLYAARAQAIQRQLPVAFCGSSDGVTCDGVWQAGQLIVATTTGAVLHQDKALPTRCRLTLHNGFGKNDSVLFGSNGETIGAQGSFYICASDESLPCSRVIFLQTGRIRVEFQKQ